MLPEVKQFFVENAHQIKKAGAEGSAGLGVSALTLNEWVALGTLGYLALQAAYLVWKWVREAKGKKRNE